MMRQDGSKQLKMTFLTLEELMPESHFLRNLEQCVDFSFIISASFTISLNRYTPKWDDLPLILCFW